MFGFLSNNLYTGHNAADTSGLSPRIWSRVTGSMMSSSGDKRLVLAGDDFTSFYGLVTSKVGFYAGEAGAYKSYEETGGSITQVATEKSGVIAITSDGTDNDDMALAAGGATGVLGAISDTAANAHLTAFECRFKVSAVTDDMGAFFVGLTEEGLAAVASMTDNTGVMASKDHIGFCTVHTNGGDAGTNAVLQFVDQKAGQTQVVKIASLKTLVADTWYKAGFVYDPTAPASRQIAVYLDNVEQSTYVTAADIAVATGSAFPDGEEMTFSALTHQGGATGAWSLYLDWWGFAQLI
jgi:hypothetical protein